MGGGDTQLENPFRILVVCTANLCRSPMAEHLLARAMDHAGSACMVSSAGVAARDGQPMHNNSAKVLADRGFDTGGWRSRRLTGGLLDGADLVLTATADHRRQIVTFDPRSAARTFTLLQFARLAASAGPVPYGDADPSSTETFEQWSIHARGQIQPAAPHEDDLADPIGRPLRAYRACAARVDDVVAVMVGPIRVR